jgi:hypothetical protein
VSAEFYFLVVLWCRAAGASESKISTSGGTYFFDGRLYGSVRFQKSDRFESKHHKVRTLSTHEKTDKSALKCSKLANPNAP